MEKIIAYSIQTSRKTKIDISDDEILLSILNITKKGCFIMIKETSTRTN